MSIYICVFLYIHNLELVSFRTLINHLINADIHLTLLTSCCVYQFCFLSILLITSLLCKKTFPHLTVCSDSFIFSCDHLTNIPISSLGVVSHFFFTSCFFFFTHSRFLLRINFCIMHLLFCNTLYCNAPLCVNPYLLKCSGRVMFSSSSLLFCIYLFYRLY